MRKLFSFPIFLVALLAACRPATITPQTTLPISTATPPAIGISPSRVPPLPTATSASQTGLPVGLIYTTGIGNGLWLVGVNGQAQLLTGQNYPILSPDQKQVLYAIGYEGDIWLHNLSTGVSHNLTNTSAEIEGDFQWWPANPNLIVFHFRPADNLEPGAGYLSTINTDGGNYLVVDSDIGSISPAALSPDGQTIAYDRGGTPWLYRLNRGPEPMSLEPFGLTFKKAANPEWSPDGQMLAWKVYGDESGTDGWSGVAILDLPRQKGYLRHRYSLLGGSGILSQLAWSPDGQWLAVVNQAEIAGEKSSLWVLRADGSEEHHLGYAQSPVWSPDSRTLAFWSWLPKSDSYLDSQAMLVDMGHWQPRQLDLPEGAQVADWVTLKP